MGLFDNVFGKKDEQNKINILGKEYEINPEAMAQSQIGLDKYQLKDYKGAIVAFSNAITHMPRNQNFYTMRGTAYEDMGNDFEAEKDFRKSLELRPNGFVSAYRLGMVYFRKKDFENAIKWLKVSYDNAPDGDLEHIGIGKNNIMFVAKKLIAGNLGNILTQVKRYEESFMYLDKAIMLDPNYPNPYMAKGLALAQVGKVKEGITYLEKAKSLGMDEANPLIDLLKNSKGHDEAEKFYEKGIKMQDAGDFQGAIQAYNKAIEINPDYPDAYYNRGTAFADLAQNDDAIKDYTICIQIDPNYAKAYFNRGAVKLKHDRNEARKDFMKAGQLGIAQAYDIIKQYCD
jgi:tetratricopeptide (TPR) repeat protein